MGSHLCHASLASGLRPTGSLPPASISPDTATFAGSASKLDFVTSHLSYRAVPTRAHTRVPLGQRYTLPKGRRFYA